MRKSFLFMLLSSFMGIIFLGIVITNMIFIFIIGEPNQELLRETPMLLTITLIAWVVSMFLMMVYGDLEKEVNDT